MSYFEGNYYSVALQRQVSLCAVLPIDAPSFMTQGNKYYEREMKTLYLLHGYSENHRAWLCGSAIQEIALKYNIAVIMPHGDNSFYLNQKGSGKQYETFVGEELVNFTRKTFGLSSKQEDTFIGGLSMGGFGSIHTGLKYSDTFGKIFALSSAMIVNELKNQKPGFSNDIADYDYYVTTFGNLDELEESENNPEFLVKKRKAEQRKIPPIFMACGTEDFLLLQNREFHKFLIEEGVEVIYNESEGVHDWRFWNQYLEPALKWALGE